MERAYKVFNSIALIFLGALFCLPVVADIVRRDWPAVSNASLYEFEISENSKFTAQALVRQGASPESHFSTDLRPGLYYFRHRPLDAKGKPGAWSTVEKIIVRGQSTFNFHTPTHNEIVDVPDTTQAVIYFEWATVAGAHDYELKLRQLNKETSRGEPLSKIVTAPSVTINNIAPGTWLAKVEARAGGQVFGQTPEISIQVLARPQPRPQILAPREGDQYPAFELIRARWIRKVDGLRSHVFIHRLDEKRHLISEEPLFNSNSTWIPALEVGKYQMTVRDYLSDSSKFVENSTSFSVALDPMGLQSRQLGWRLQLFPTAIIFGTSTQSSDVLPHTIMTSPSFRVFDLRLAIPFNENWGLDLQNALRFRVICEFNCSSTSKSTNQDLIVGATYKQLPLGPSKPIYYKLLLGLFASDALSQGPTHHASQFFGLAALVPEIELDYGAWNSRYRVAARAQIRLPVASLHGSYYGSSRPAFYPALMIEGQLKRRWGQNTWGILGTDFLFQHIKINEKDDPTQRPTQQRDVNFALSAGLELNF